MERFLDKMQQSVKSVSKEVVDKSKELSNEAKIRATIIAQEHKIKEEYKKIGELYYTLHKEDGEEAFEHMIETIRKSEMKISAAKKDLYKGKVQKEYVKTEPCSTQVEEEDILDYQFIKTEQNETTTEKEE